MGGFIVFIIVGLVVAGLVSKAKKINQQQNTGGGGSENFPFPPFEVDDDDPWDFGNRAPRPSVQPTSQPSSQPMADEMTVAEGASAAVVYRSIAVADSVQGEIGNSAALSEGWEDRAKNEVIEQFDLQQAIVYEAILKPKFDDYIL